MGNHDKVKHYIETYQDAIVLVLFLEVKRWIMEKADESCHKKGYRERTKKKKNTFKCCQKNNEGQRKRGALFQIVPQIEEVDN